AHLAFAVMTDQCALLLQHFKAAEIAGKIEAVAAYRHRLGDLDDALPRMRIEIGTAERRHVLAPHAADGDQEPQCYIRRDFSGPAPQLLAASDKERRFWRGRTAKAAVIAHARSGRVARIAHDELGDPDLPRQVARARQEAGQH